MFHVLLFSLVPLFASFLISSSFLFLPPLLIHFATYYSLSSLHSFPVPHPSPSFFFFVSLSTSPFISPSFIHLSSPLPRPSVLLPSHLPTSFTGLPLPPAYRPHHHCPWGSHLHWFTSTVGFEEKYSMSWRSIIPSLLPCLEVANPLPTATARWPIPPWDVRLVLRSSSRDQERPSLYFK